MAIDIQLLSFMPHTVTIRPFSSINSYGEDANTGTQRTAKAYVEPSQTLATNPTTREQYQAIRVYVADTQINLQDSILLPDGSSPVIITIERHLEVSGIEHTVVTCG